MQLKSYLQSTYGMVVTIYWIMLHLLVVLFSVWVTSNLQDELSKHYRLAGHVRVGGVGVCMGEVIPIGVESRDDI